MIRRLGPGDESVIERLATQGPPKRARDLLEDRRTIFVVAFDGDDPVGFALAYELVRRHGDPSKLFLYEVEVDEQHRRRGIGKALLAELGRIAREQGIRSGWVLTKRENQEATALYRSAGAVDPHEETMWTFEYEER